ncbi:DNA-binding transcriptional regulator, MerR family [Paenibacillus uliginis N3/975]|uniref:DNA-binding transcriptional regulator, MerR family n=1 Tax=Paenibacillus uliginis N3/975 TaxID=1313296 RepID=A0A1X7HBK0_9BACL|nr:MerR family transcriptional regulator [Paenibacillus uliginis]SMF83398.1 DNA-binding transcriptional regulator, MerR family [Paenibacillus uliginis N3/975]
MRIGELANRTGVSIRSLRYYEQQGLLAPKRHDNGYREYSSFMIEQVQTIQFYLKLGLTTEQIAGFLNCVLMNKEAFCKEVLPVYQQKLKEIDDQIKQLESIKSNLEERISSIIEEHPASEINSLKVGCNNE